MSTNTSPMRKRASRGDGKFGINKPGGRRSRGAGHFFGVPVVKTNNGREFSGLGRWFKLSGECSCRLRRSVALPTINIAFPSIGVALVLLVLGFAANLQAQDDATLAWKFETGDAMAVEFQQTQDVLTRIDARDRTLESELILGVAWSVTDVAQNGNATIEQTIQRIRVKTGAPGAAIKKFVDVDTARDGPLRGVSRDVMKQIKTLIGLKFTVVMKPVGEVVSVKPGSNVAAVVASLPDTSALRRVFSGPAMAKLVSDSSFALPQESVAKGASWNDESTISMTANDGRKFSFDRVVKSTLKNVDDTIANIDVEITLTQAPLAGSGASGNELTSPLELVEFTGGGQVEFDRSTGTLTSSTMVSETQTLVVYREDKVKTTTKVTNQMTVVRK